MYSECQLCIPLSTFDPDDALSGPLPKFRYLDLLALEALPGPDRVSAMLEGNSLVRVFPVWGLTSHPDGRLECACRLGKSCPKPGKHPILKGWPERATRKLDTIHNWLAKWPGMNFGGLMGGGLVAVDVDSLDAWNWLEARALFHGVPIPHTVATRSGRDAGGYHLIFACPLQDVKSGRGRGHANIDVKGYRGYIVLPGSRHESGRYYQWLEGCHPADLVRPATMPAWMMTELLIRPAGPTAACATRPRDRPPNEPSEEKGEIWRRLWDMNRIDLNAFVIDPQRRPPVWKMKDLFSGRKRNHRAIIATWRHRRGEGDYSPFKDSSDSAYELALSGFAACEKWTPQEIVDLIMVWRAMHRPGGPLPHRSRLEATLTKAFLLAEKRGLIRKKRGPKPGTLKSQEATPEVSPCEEFSPISHYPFLLPSPPSLPVEEQGEAPDGLLEELSALAA